MTSNNGDTPWKDGHYKAEGLSDAVDFYCLIHFYKRLLSPPSDPK